MERRYLLKLLALFLMLSNLLSLSAVPLSRNLALKNHNLPAAEIANQRVTSIINQVPVLYEWTSAIAIITKQERKLGEETARMNIEINDYPGSGANPRHDPRSPGRN